MPEDDLRAGEGGPAAGAPVPPKSKRRKRRVLFIGVPLVLLALLRPGRPVLPAIAAFVVITHGFILPAALLATTVNVYAVPFVNPLTVSAINAAAAR